MMKKIIVSILFLACLVPSYSQVLNPVKWKFSVNQTSDKEYELLFNAKIDKTWHVYSQFIPEGGPIPTSFVFEKAEGYELIGKVDELSSLIKEYDKSFEMELSFFATEARFKQKVKITGSVPVIVKGYVEFMTCDNQRCLPPAEVEFELKLESKSVDAGSQVALQNNDSVVHDKPEKVQEIKTTSQQLSESSLWGFFILAFFGGLVSILMPCVFPMIPMTVSFFMHSSENKRKAKLQAMFFGLSIIGIYSGIGLIVSATLGPDFINWLSTHWLPNLFFFTIFIVFAASFFGMFEITLPSWLVNKSDKQADKGGYTGAFFMAFTLVLVSFSCTVPIVGTILVEAARGEVLKPVVGMLGFSLAFALPFGFFAFFPSKLNNLPKSGGWLNSVKVVLGFIELALSLKFLMVADQTYHWNLLSRDIYIAIWIVLFTLQGFYLLGKIRFEADTEVKHIKVPRLLFVIVTFAFVVYLIPGLFGAPLSTLSGYLPPQTSQKFDLNAIIRENSKNIGNSAYNGNSKNGICENPKYADFLHLPHGLEGYFDYDQALACAREKKKPLFIDFTGHGCVNCREMEQNVWSDPKVLKRLREDFIVVALYVDDKYNLPEPEWKKSVYDGKIMKTIGKKNADLQITRYGTNSQPNYVLLDLDERLLAPMRAHDLDVEKFVAFLDQAIREFKKRYPAN